MRIAIFCALGPPLGVICIFGPALFFSLGSGAALGPSAGAPAMLAGFLVLMLFSYLPGFVPAIVTCQVDDYISDKLAMWPRVAVTGLAGAVITVAWMALILGRSPEHPWAALGSAPVGAIPAMVCSWLAGRWEQGARTSAQAASLTTHLR